LRKLDRLEEEVRVLEPISLGLNRGDSQLFVNERVWRR
jgi:hypothetical protein